MVGDVARWTSAVLLKFRARARSSRRLRCLASTIRCGSSSVGRAATFQACRAQRCATPRGALNENRLSYALSLDLLADRLAAAGRPIWLGGAVNGSR